MSSPRIFALSSSRVAGSGYLEMAAPLIGKFLGRRKLNVAFIPFAAADGGYERYLQTVREALSHLPHRINVVIEQTAFETISAADAVMVGGGNTFKLLHTLYRYDLLNLLAQKISEGSPYIGWSAGSNITGLSIGTTNDMPIVEPPSFRALGFFPFQINPHYHNLQVEGQHGETRNQRLSEFVLLNRGVPIVCLPEGTALHLEGNSLQYSGDVAGVLFTGKLKARQPVTQEILPGQDLSFLF